MLGKMPKMCSTKSKMKMVDDPGFDEFLSRISKTLYYGDKFHEEDHLSYPVIELAAEIYSDLKTGKSIDRLYLNEAAEITERVKVDPCYLVLALLYIERLKDCNSTYLDNVAPSQLFLISLVLASKFHADGEFELSLSMFEKFSEWTQSEMFGAELAFLDALQWKTHVSEAEFYVKLVQLETCLAKRLGGRRGWFTYTEMNTLLDAAWLTNVTHLLATVSCVCLTTYTAGVFTLLASSALASHLSASLASLILSSLTLSSTDPSTLVAGLPPLYSPGPTRLSGESLGSSRVNTDLEEEIEAMVDENRIGELLRRLEALERLPGDDSGCAAKTGYLGGDRGSYWPGSGDLGTGNLNLAGGLETKDSVLGTGNLFTDKLVLESLEEMRLNCEKVWNFTFRQNDWNHGLDWLCRENQLGCARADDVVYSHIPNSTSFVNSAVDLDGREVCFNSIINQSSSQAHSMSSRQAHSKTIPLVARKSYTLTNALASLSEFSLSEYFNILPLQNVSSFLFSTDFDWNSYDRSEKSDGKDDGSEKSTDGNRYFQDIDRNGYRWMYEKIDLKF